MDSPEKNIITLQPVSRGTQSQDPFFVHTGKPAADAAFSHFLEDVQFANIVIGWRDKHNRHGITLIDKGNKKVGAIVCATEAIRDGLIPRIIKHLDIMKE